MPVLIPLASQMTNNNHFLCLYAGILHVQRTLSRCLLRWRSLGLCRKRAVMVLAAVMESRQGRFFELLSQRLGRRRAKLERLIVHAHAHEQLPCDGRRRAPPLSLPYGHLRGSHSVSGTIRRGEKRKAYGYLQLNFQLLRIWRRWIDRFRRNRKQTNARKQPRVVAKKGQRNEQPPLVIVVVRSPRSTPALPGHTKQFKRIYLNRMVQHTLQACRSSHHMRVAAAGARARLLRTMLPRAMQLLRRGAGDRRSLALASTHFRRRVNDAILNALMSHRERRAASRRSARSGDCLWALRCLRKALARWSTWVQPRRKVGQRDRLGRALHTRRVKRAALTRWCDHCMQSCHFLRLLIAARRGRSRRQFSEFFLRWRHVARSKKTEEEEVGAEIAARRKSGKSVKRVLQSHPNPLVRAALWHRRRVGFDHLSRWIAHTHFSSTNRAYAKSVFRMHQGRLLSKGWRKLKTLLLDRKRAVRSGRQLRMLLLMHCAMRKLVARKSHRRMLWGRVRTLLRRLFLRRWVRFARGRNARRRESGVIVLSHNLTYCVRRSVRLWLGIARLRKNRRVSSTLAHRYRSGSLCIALY